ncbi:zinc finger protein 385D-like isoform X2 [Amphiprion ocellaris]|uniref:zinc finger protein 385D-like isoform X2 n=1 Tax=Amphiprion ocellaris TaxID=80972 RepID=UPI0024115703|nr:zinc finger protein 385D-like isoform X2 [Amphiprion ocellaris]
MYFGNVCHSALPPLTRPTLGRTQASPDPKALLPFHLLPGFADMDPIHKALMGPGFGLSSPLKRKPSSCGVCRLRFNSEAQASSHYSGTKHAKRLKALDAPDSKIRTSEPVAKETTSQILPSPCSQPSSSDTTSGEPSAPNPTSETAPSTSGPTETVKTPSDPSLSPSPRLPERKTQKDGEAEAPEEETEEEKAIRLLYCSLCKVAVNSASQLQAHNSGTKHKTMLEARSGDGAIKSFPRMGVKAKMAAPSESATGLQNKTFHCEICDVHVNSETQLKQHISSRRHKDRAADKTDTTEEPRPDQTSGLLPPAASALRRRCHGIVAPFPPPTCLKLGPRPVSQSAPSSGAAPSGPWTHLLNTHISSVFPLLTPSMSQSVLNYS